MGNSEIQRVVDQPYEVVDSIHVQILYVREREDLSSTRWRLWRVGKGFGHNPSMHAVEKYDIGIVLPEKEPNNMT